MSETAEQRQTRRRWINLAELVAVAGLIIAALTLYLNWSEQKAARQEKQAEKAEAATKERFAAHGALAKDGKSVALQSDDAHSIGDVRVTFPSELGMSAKDAVSGAIQRDWFAEPLLKLTDGGADGKEGRLPVLVAYSYTDAEGEHQASGVYDVIWQTHGRLLRGRELAITGFRLRRNGGSQAELDRLWAREKPTAATG